MCGDKKISLEFFKTDSKLMNNGGYIPICKSCLVKWYRTLIKRYNENYIQALIHLCIALDLPYSSQLVDKVINIDNPSSTLLVYIEELYKLPDRKRSDSEESIKDISMVESAVTSESLNNPLIKEFAVTPDVLTRWGSKFSKEDYFTLENKFNEVLEYYGGTAPTEIDLYKDYAINELLKSKAVEAGDTDEARKLQQAQSKLMNDAKLTPKKATDANNDSVLVGMFIKGIEEYRPIMEQKDKYKDVDKMEKENEYRIAQLKRSTSGGWND